MGAVRFIHAADLHLGKVFSGLSTLDRRAELVDAVSDTFGALIELTLDERVDFLILAGDTFDTLSVPYATHRRFVAGLERLDEAGIATYIVTGNHDPLISWGKRVDALPASVRIFSTDAVERIVHERDGEAVAALYGRSYLMQSQPENLAVGYRRDAGDAFAIGVLHTSVTDADAYAPCAPEDLRRAGMDYWALGHIHKQGRVLESPLAIQSGSVQGLNVNERSAHGAYLVERSESGAIEATFIPLARVAWAHLDVDISDAQTLDDIRAAIVRAGVEAIQVERRPVGGRVFLTGRSDMHAELSPAVLDALTADVNRELSEPGAWLALDSIVDRSSLPIDLEALAAPGTFSEVVVEELAGILDESSLPRDLIDRLTSQAGTVFAPDSALRESILDRARTRIVDALSGGAL